MKKQKGGKIIGQGMSGVVHYPALQCKIPDESPVGDYVSKVSSKKSAEKEFENTIFLRKLKPDFAIYPEYMCEYNEKQNLIFSRFGGYSLVYYYDFLENLCYSKNADKSEFNEDYYNDIIVSLKNLKENIEILNKKGYFHGDVSADNILYNENTKKSYLIDFENRGKRNDSKDIQNIINHLEDFKKRLNR